MNAPTPTQQAVGLLAMQGLNDRCVAIVVDAFHKLAAELRPVLEGGYDINEAVDIITTTMHDQADQFRAKVFGP